MSNVYDISLMVELITMYYFFRKMKDIKLILMLPMHAVAFLHSVPPKDLLTSDGEEEERLSKRAPPGADVCHGEEAWC